MIFRVYLKQENDYGDKLRYDVFDLHGNLTAVGSNAEPKCGLLFRIGEEEYRFRMLPHRIDKAPVAHRYPLSSGSRRTFGFSVYRGEEECMFYYKEAEVVGRTGIFKKTMGLTVLVLGDQIYRSYRVGFPGENSHYYCLLDQSGKTVAVLERHTYREDACRATLYVEEEAFVRPALLASAAETMDVVYTGERYSDPSAGHYISLLEEEKAMFDPGFIPRVKALDGVTD